MTGVTFAVDGVIWYHLFNRTRASRIPASDDSHRDSPEGCPRPSARECHTIDRDLVVVGLNDCCLFPAEQSPGKHGRPLVGHSTIELQIAVLPFRPKRPPSLRRKGR